MPRDWPHEVGDDPSFFAAHRFNGALSWGVFRQDLGNNLNQADIVVFFSFHRGEETNESEYKFCAVTTVEKKASHQSIWSDPGLKLFRKYLNRRITPLPGRQESWGHFEPAGGGSSRRLVVADVRPSRTKEERF